MTRDQVSAAASELGKLAKGIPKTLTPEQREQRRQQLAVAKKKRHPKLPGKIRG